MIQDALRVVNQVFDIINAVCDIVFDGVVNLFVFLFHLTNGVVKLWYLVLSSGHILDDVINELIEIFNVFLEMSNHKVVLPDFFL